MPTPTEEIFERFVRRSVLSPLRYPGGKRRLVAYVAAALVENQLRPDLFVIIDDRSYHLEELEEVRRAAAHVGKIRAREGALRCRARGFAARRHEIVGPSDTNLSGGHRWDRVVALDAISFNNCCRTY